MTVNSQVLDYIASEESFLDKSVIIKEGSMDDWVYVILEGRVKIKKQTSRGLLTIDTLSKGDFVGEMAMLKQGNKTRTATRIKKLISNLIQNLEEATKKAVDMIVESR
ncbi:MAG: cyclic nucleotide-binding domain-containing protein [Deltaproteobacteria bacterium]|nr:cyclic nucleotide-binding domain-containing protein [Deltaproteobacteria bacterium]